MFAGSALVAHSLMDGLAIGAGFQAGGTVGAVVAIAAIAILMLGLVAFKVADTADPADDSGDGAHRAAEVQLTPRSVPAQ